jgi:hypothetical protein
MALDEEDPRRHVEEQHRPERPELGAAERLRRCHVCDRAGADRRRGATARNGERESDGRVADEGGRGAAEDEEDRAREGERLQDDFDRRRGEVRLEEVGVEEGTEAEPHHDEAAAEPATIREPLGHRRDRRHVAEPQPEPADDAIARDEPAPAEPGGAEPGEQVADPPQERSGDRDRARTGPVLPAAAHDRADPEEEDGGGEGGGRTCGAPAERGRQRLREEAPSVDRTEAGHEGRARCGHPPATRHAQLHPIAQRGEDREEWHGGGGAVEP